MALIRGIVWNDTNQNQVRDIDEAGVDSVTMFLDENGNGFIDEGEDTSTTDADGNYLFDNLIPGIYRVSQQQTPGFQSSVVDTSQLPFTGLASNGQGAVAWNTTSGAPEPAKVGHVLNLPNSPDDTFGSFYYFASRDYDNIGIDSSGAIRFEDDIVGFDELKTTLSQAGYSPNDITVKFGLSTLGDDIEGQDWFTIGNVEFRYYRGGTVTLQLDGEELVSGSLDEFFLRVDLDNRSGVPLAPLSGGIKGFVPSDASGNSSASVQQVAQALLNDLNNDSIDFQFNSLSPTSGEGIFADSGRFGALFEADFGIVHRSSEAPITDGSYSILVSSSDEAVSDIDFSISPQVPARTDDIENDIGSTFETAFDIGSLGALQTFSGTVGPTDRNDFYRFTLTENSDVSLGLTGLGPEPAQLESVAALDGDGIFNRFDDTIESDIINDGLVFNTDDRFINTPLSAGTYFARVVTWYDNQNSGYTLSAQATPRTNDIADDPGDSFETAFDIGSLGALQTFSGTVGPTDRNDFYRFTLTENSDVSLGLTGLGPEPAQLEIVADLDGDGIFNRFDDTIESDSINDGLVFNTDDRFINTPLSAGTCFACVVTWYDNQNSGYTLSAQATPRTNDIADDPGDSFETAFDIGSLGALQTFSGTVGPTDRNDFYRFTLTENSDVSLGLTGLGPEPAQLEIVADLDGDGIFNRFDDTIESDSINDGLVFNTDDRFINTPLSAGTYFARVVTWYDNQNSGYTLSAQATPRTNDIADDPGDSFETAFDIGSLGALQTFSGTVGPTDRNDFYRFTLTENSDVSLGLTGLGPEPAQLEIVADLDGDGIFNRFDDTIESDSINDGLVFNTDDRFINTPLSAGTYFARVVTWYDNQNSGYTLSAQATPRTDDTDPGNTYATALDIGTLSTLQTFGGSVDPTDRNDFYQFTLTESSDVSLGLTGLGPEPAQLQIVADINGDGVFQTNEIIEDDTVNNSSSSTADRFINTALSAGTYFARVLTSFPSQNSGYTLAAQATATGSNTTDPGNDINSALNVGNLDAAQTFTSTVGSLDRNDFYTFTLDEFGEVNFTLKDLQEPAQLSLIVDFDGDGIWDRGEEIASDEISNTSSDTQDRSITRMLAPGTYWLDVWTQYGTQNTNYTLESAALSPIDVSATDPGNTLDTAQDLGTLDSNRSFTNFVGSRDRNDYYKFSLAQASEVGLSLRNLSDDADLALIFDANSNGQIDFREVLSQVALNDNSDRSLTYPLGVGDYFVRVFTDSSEQNTAYDLDISATVLSIPDNAGGNFEVADTRCPIRPAEL